MTRPEITWQRDLTFSNWVRQNLPDSREGFWVTDIDFVLWDKEEKCFMLLEVKQHSGIMRPFQEKIFKLLDKWLRQGVDEDWEYLGYHVIRFENRSFEDGRCWLDGEEVTEEELIDFLSMKKSKYKYCKYKEKGFYAPPW